MGAQPVVMRIINALKVLCVAAIMLCFGLIAAWGLLLWIYDIDVYHQ